MKAYWLLCMCLCATCLIRAQPSSGDRFYSQGDYRAAAIAWEVEYMRSASDSSLLKEAYAYKAAGHFSGALAALQRISHLDVSYEKALMYYMMGDIENSYNQLLRMVLGQSAMTNASRLLYTMVLVRKNDFDGARKYLLSQLDAFDLTKEKIDQVFDKKIRVKNPQRAENISLLLPGFGQAYAGYPVRGFFSGLMQAGSAGFAYYSLLHQYYFSGVLTGAALFYTFYLGGARYASQLAEVKNKENQEVVISRLKTIIRP